MIRHKMYVYKVYLNQCIKQQWMIVLIEISVNDYKALSIALQPNTQCNKSWKKEVTKQGKSL